MPRILQFLTSENATHPTRIDTAPQSHHIARRAGMLRTLQPAAVAAALAAAGGRRAAAGRGGAAPAPYSTSAGALDWLRKFTNYEQSGVPQAAGTNTDAGFDLVRGRNQRRPVACRAPPHSVAECPYGCCVT